MLAASFEPKVVEEKASKNVERLTSVRETARVVPLKARGIVFLLEGSFSEEDERPGDGEMVGRLPFIPSATEGAPGLLGGGAIHETVLGRLREALVAAFASGLEPHNLEPRAHREPSIEGQLDEGPHLAWAGIVPNSRNNLGGRGVPKVQPLDEFDDPRGQCGFLAFW